MKIRRLKDFVGVAEACSDLFGPDDCEAGEVLVRRGWIKSISKGKVESIMAHCADEGVFSVQVWVKDDGQWRFEHGGSSRITKEAILSVIDGN